MAKENEEKNHKGGCWTRENDRKYIYPISIFPSGAADMYSRNLHLNILFFMSLCYVGECVADPAAV